jgi:hypothetical protein
MKIYMKFNKRIKQKQRKRRMIRILIENEINTAMK